MLEDIKIELNNRFKRYNNIQCIIKKFFELKSCAYCFLRCFTITDDTFFNTSLVELNQVLSEIADQEIQFNQDEQCPFCYNVLNDDCVETLANQLVTKFQEEGYDNNKFEFGIQSSLTMIMREHFIELYFKSLLNDSSIQVKIVELKSILRQKLIAKLNQSNVLQYTQGGLLDLYIIIDHQETSKDYLKLLNYKENYSEVHNSKRSKKAKQIPNFKWNKTKLMSYLNKFNLDQLTELTLFPPTSTSNQYPSITEINFVHKPIYLAGRYLKLDRFTSQTPFFAGPVKLADHSVSDSFEPVLKTFQASSYNMVPAGREDMDVRMLGTGRPFYLEIKNPRFTDFNQIQFEELQSLINQVHEPVKFTDLSPLRSDQISIIKQGEETKSKYYRALIWTSLNTNQLNFDTINQTPSALNHLKQSTPLRVFHRRAAGVREKQIYAIEVKPISDHLIQAVIHAQAGTYIKELVHGDLGRTTPSFSQVLGCACDLLELDVIHVDLKWPPNSNSH